MRPKKTQRKGSTANRKNKFENIGHSMERRLLQLYAMDAEVESDQCYVLEAKVGPRDWRRADKIYPEIIYLKPFYRDREHAHEAKTYIKWYLKGNRPDQPKKLPLRIRECNGSAANGHS